ncbi:MAG: hypothetical protein COB20_06410 [SAR86 cluster bacterium]|uniref:DUF4386 family protein n=1 Tax=SAR86 cluster bacterium TaxID=2030880 RepID=A0A2A4X7I9_9GAMM|nr:MAG: hypothetical protein COB20_06410 [SAR86 cluster bacterium]
MTNYDYWRPAVAAILLAVLYPLYWVLEFTANGNFPPDDFADYMRWSSLDWLFLSLGFLIIYQLLGLRRILSEQLNYSGIDIPILISVSVTVVFFFGLSFSQVTLVLLEGDSLAAYEEIAATIGVVVLVGSVILGGVAEILMGCLLLRDSSTMPPLVRIFAIITLIMGIFDLTVIFSFISLFIYPVAMLVLAAYFLSKPETIEVV